MYECINLLSSNEGIACKILLRKVGDVYFQSIVSSESISTGLNHGSRYSINRGRFLKFGRGLWQQKPALSPYVAFVAMINQWFIGDCCFYRTSYSPFAAYVRLLEHHLSLLANMYRCGQSILSEIDVDSQCRNIDVEKKYRMDSAHLAWIQRTHERLFIDIEAWHSVLMQRKRIWIAHNCVHIFCPKHG